MSYTMKGRIRYSEIGEDEALTLKGIVNYFQDCSTFHSEDVGLGLRMLQEHNRGWVLSSWQIVVNRYPKLCEKIEVVTWPYAFKGFLGNRNFVLQSEEGEILAYANTLWVFMDLEKGCPTVAKAEFMEGYNIEPPLEMNYASRKIAVPKSSQPGEPFPVRAHHLDTNHHVNNGQYVQMAQDLLPQDFHVRQLRAEYKRQARIGDMITPLIHKEDNCYTIALCDGDLNPYVIVEFTLQDQ